MQPPLGVHEEGSTFRAKIPHKEMLATWKMVEELYVVPTCEETANVAYFSDYMKLCEAMHFKIWLLQRRGNNHYQGQ